MPRWRVTFKMRDGSAIQTTIPDEKHRNILEGALGRRDFMYIHIRPTADDDTDMDMLHSDIVSVLWTKLNTPHFCDTCMWHKVTDDGFNVCAKGHTCYITETCKEWA